MENTGKSALVQQIEEAEKVIKSYAYGQDLEEAIAFLKENDPKNEVLATIKNFDGDIVMLKALNAMYRADKAREDNDMAELERIGEFLTVSENEELREEGINILSEIPEVTDEQVATVREMLGRAAEGSTADPADNANSGMSDEKILANAEGMEYIIGNEKFQRDVYNETVEKAKNTITVTETDGLNIKDEEDLWTVKMLSILNEVSMDRMDDATFAGKDTRAKTADLKQDVIARFWNDLSAMAGLSAVDTSANDETNNARAKAASEDCLSGKNVKVKANQFFASFTASKNRAAGKAQRLEAEGKTKSAGWLSRKWQKFNQAMDRRFGTNPVEFGQELLGYFSHARGITNTAMSGLVIAGAMYSIPVGLAAAGAFALYQAYAPSKWMQYEKKKANYAAAVAKGNEDEIKIWSGWNGIRNAYKSIQANAKEKERFERQRKRNLKYGLVSAAIIGVAAPVIMSGGLAAVGLGLGAAATYTGARALSAGTRMTGANVNAYEQMKEAKRQFKEDGTAESEKAYKKACTYFGLGIVCSGLCEWMMADHVADSYNEQMVGLEKENLAKANALLQEQQAAAEPQEPVAETQEPAAEENQEPAPENEVPAYDWHTKLQEELTPRQYNDLMSKFTGIFENRAEIFGMEDKAQGLTLDNVCNNIAKAQAHGQLPTDMTVGETLYKYMKLVENTERAEPVPGTHHYLRTILDANKQPMYWVDQEQMRALNDIILCGKEVSISADVLGKSLDRINDAGVYVGEGANVGVTHNRFVGFGRGEDCPDGTNNVNAWERVKGVVKRIVNPKPVIEPEVDDAVVIEDQVKDVNTGDNVEIVDKVKDGHADDGASVDTKFTTVKTDSNTGQLEEDRVSISRNKVTGHGFVPGARVNSGPEL